MDIFYPSKYNEYYITSENKSEEIASIIMDWYRKFLRGEIQRERTSDLDKVHPLVMGTFLEKMENHIKNINFCKFTYIFTTDYGSEGELKEIYEDSCRIYNQKPYDWNMKVVFPVKWCVAYYSEGKLGIR